MRGSEDNETDNCLEKDCTCDCADESALSPCKQKYCSPVRKGTCVSDYQYAEIADGTCHGFCMNSFCNFDGGDCLSSSTWYLSLSEVLTRLDSDGDRRISREEYESSLWLLPNFNQSGDDGGTDLFSLCETQREGLSIKHLALGERGEDGSAGGGHFSLVSHAQVDQLNTALYIMGSADENNINALAYGGSEVEAEEVASILFSVVETLRGKPWTDRGETHFLYIIPEATIRTLNLSRSAESFYGADVAASVTIKMLSRCDRAHIGKLARLNR